MKTENFLKVQDIMGKFRSLEFRKNVIKNAENVSINSDDGVCSMITSDSELLRLTKKKLLPSIEKEIEILEKQLAEL